MNVAPCEEVIAFRKWERVANSILSLPHLAVSFVVRAHFLWNVGFDVSAIIILTAVRCEQQ